MTASSRQVFPTLGRLGPPAIGIAIALGIAARLFLLFARPLWHDEIFTLTLARKPLAELLALLRIDSGPPLHYLAAKLLLFSPTPSSWDLAVRALSTAASLAHLPLLVLVGRRLGAPRAGAVAAALFALFPLAIEYAAEGRAYALASLLTLLALERALAVRQGAGHGAAAALSLSAAAAALTHYLAAFPLLGLAALLQGCPPAARRRLLAAGLGAGVLVLPWALIALRQPTASMDWTRDAPAQRPATRFALDLASGADVEGPALLPLMALALAGLAVALRSARRGPAAPLAAAFLLGLAALLLAQALTGRLLLPERTALVFLPLTALLLASGPLVLPLASAALSLAVLLARLPMATVPSPTTVIAQLLLPRLARERLVAVGTFALELDYRCQRAGLRERVVPFPSEAAAHPGWYREPEGALPRYRDEARALVGSLRAPTLFLLPHGLAAAAALEEAVAPLRPAPVLVTPFLHVVAAGRRE